MAELGSEVTSIASAAPPPRHLYARTQNYRTVRGVQLGARNSSSVNWLATRNALGNSTHGYCLSGADLAMRAPFCVVGCPRPRSWGRGAHGGLPEGLLRIAAYLSDSAKVPAPLMTLNGPVNRFWLSI